jgi:hypothetical protein
MKIRRPVMKTVLWITLFLILFQTASVKPHAEGANADLRLSVSQTTLHIGKSFTVTLRIKPNANIDITTFDAVIRFDAEKLELLKADGRPASVHEGFDLTVSNIPANEIVVLGEENKGGPIQVRGETDLLIMTFKARENAVVGSDAVFSILQECTVNIPGTGTNPPEPIPLTIADPVSYKIGSKLDVNANLSSLTIRPGTLIPAFSKTLTSYQANVATGTSSLDIAAVAESATSTVTISGGQTLQYGRNTVTVTVTAQDRDISRVYTLIVTRATPVPTTTPTLSVQESSQTQDFSMSISDQSELSEEESFEQSQSDEVVDSYASSEENRYDSSDSQPLDPQQKEIRLWKQISLVLLILFLAAFCTSLWFIIEKASNRDKIVKIKRR